jgi:hypothetical protein
MAVRRWQRRPRALEAEAPAPWCRPARFQADARGAEAKKFNGYTSIFMHPSPRGSALGSSVQDVTTELGKARAFLDKELVAV